MAAIPLDQRCVQQCNLLHLSQNAKIFSLKMNLNRVQYKKYNKELRFLEEQRRTGHSQQWSVDGCSRGAQQGYSEGGVWGTAGVCTGVQQGSLLEYSRGL